MYFDEHLGYRICLVSVCGTSVEYFTYLRTLCTVKEMGIFGSRHLDLVGVHLHFFESACIKKKKKRLGG